MRLPSSSTRVRKPSTAGQRPGPSAQLVAGHVDPNDLPCNREIRGCLQSINRSGRAEQVRLLSETSAEQTTAIDTTVDRFRAYELLLLPLEQVMQSPETHPEGDVLYHSLQVFALARHERPYDEEFLLAALLHDVGKAIDRRDHVVAALAALDGLISPRTQWLIEHHVEAIALSEGTLGVRLRRRLETSEDYDELLLLAQCDRNGRSVGVEVPDVPDAVGYIRELSEACGDA